MKKSILVVSVALLASCAQQTPSKNEQLKVGDDANNRTSYSLGFDLGKRIPAVLPQLSDLDKEYFYQGLRDAIEEKGQIDEVEVNKLVNESRNAAMEKRQKEQSEAMDKNKEEGLKFLAENKTKEGVKETPSGLQYKIVKAGGKVHPKATDRVEVNYEGKVLSGTIFDSSYKRGESITFGLNQVIKGWTEGLQLIGEGGEIMLYIPSDLAYGPRSAGPDIGPNSTLIFKVELIKINP
ncbi:FKBP-type peptidyl-prolyl cis-trans isomerase [bacterium]|nr:MAG: FKBP-type peptidyl-prolyl cis-trans isomerase [bacterium]